MWWGWISREKALQKAGKLTHMVFEHQEGFKYMERAFQHLKLSHSEIEQVCRHYFKNKGSLQSYEILSGGAVNTTFKVCWDGEWFALRFYVRDKNLASIEMRVYQLIQEKVHVPEMLFALPGNEPYPFAIFRFCQQLHIYDANQSEAHKLSYDLGLALANIHAIRFPAAGLFGKDLSIETLFEENSSPYFEYCFEHLTPLSQAWKRLGGARAKQVISFMKKQQHFFPIIQGGGCLVHSDFKPVNLLWNAKQGLTVLDWEFAHSGHSLIDFGILLRHFRDFPLDISHLEKGYRENGGSLPADWIQRARMTDCVNIVQLLNVQSERPQLFQSLIESLDYTIDGWEKFSNR